MSLTLVGLLEFWLRCEVRHDCSMKSWVQDIRGTIEMMLKKTKSCSKALVYRKRAKDQEVERQRRCLSMWGARVDSEC